jgi:GNAT superfamily N-acetyltransferase
MRSPPRHPIFAVTQGRSHEYSRAKAILNAGKHPTFIGKNLYLTASRNGGVLFFNVGGRDAAVAIIQPATNCLLVLCVHPNFRSNGLGRAALEYCHVSFARVVDFAVPFFEHCGFVAIGEPKQGKRFKTQVMVLASLKTLAGRISRLL